MVNLRRMLSLIICIALLFSLSACGKNEDVLKVEDLISAIGMVSFDSEDAIINAEKAYKALPAEDKEKVENYADLEEARKSYDAIIRSLEEALSDYLVNQGEKRGCSFSKLTISNLAANGENIAITGTATFSSDKSYTCSYTANVAMTDDTANTISIESWEDDFEAVYKAAQPIHWEVDYYLDDFGDETDKGYMRGVFDGEFDNSAGYGHALTAALYFDIHLDSASWDAFSIRLLEYGNRAASLSSNAVVKIKVDDTVYTSQPWFIDDNNDIVIKRGSDVFRGVINALNEGKEISFVIEDTRYSVKSTYRFVVDAYGLEDIPHNWVAQL